ncbi:HD domain-containing protein [Candidatus Woesearchaeota archaeon]|nr:HD domain-containing protein [Candidatus Woesearchaeota archaeon]
MIIPTKSECLKILKDNKVPDNIVAHLKAVCDFSMEVVDFLEKKGINVNKDLVVAGALLHDIKKINSEDHVIEGYGLVKSLGYPEVANLIKKHGLYHLEEEEFTPKTWEEKIVFYADKRVKGSKIVNVDERFEYIKQRYKKDNVEKEVEFTKKIEYELLGDEKI